MRYYFFYNYTIFKNFCKWIRTLFYYHLPNSLLIYVQIHIHNLFFSDIIKAIIPCLIVLYDYVSNYFFFSRGSSRYFLNITKPNVMNSFLKKKLLFSQVRGFQLSSFSLKSENSSTNFFILVLSKKYSSIGFLNQC